MSETTIAKSIIVFSWLPVFAAGIFSLMRFKKLEKTFKIFSGYLMLSAIFQVIAGLTWLFSINNLPLLHLYVAGGFVFIAFFYRELFRKILDTRILPVVAVLFVLFVALNILFFQSAFRFSSRALTVESVLITTLSLFTINILMNEDINIVAAKHRKSIKWINSGLLIYYSSNLLIFYFGDVFTRLFPVYLNQRTWILHSLFSIIMYSCFIIALLKHPKQNTPQPPQ